MAYIETVPEREATGETAEIYAADRERMGYLPNYTQIFSERPAVYRGWQALNGAVKETMDLCRYELTTLAAARRLRSEYCSLAHGAVLRERFFDPEALATVASDRGSAGLDRADLAAMDLAEKVAADANSVTAADIERLRGLDLADDEIHGLRSPSRSSPLLPGLTENRAHDLDRSGNTRPALERLRTLPDENFQPVHGHRARRARRLDERGRATIRPVGEVDHRRDSARIDEEFLADRRRVHEQRRVSRPRRPVAGDRDVRFGEERSKACH